MRAYTFIILCCVVSFCSFAQTTLPQAINFVDSTALPANLIPDTATIHLWQLGTTVKPFFCSDTAGCHAMMTDTVAHYPINANNWFTVKIDGTTPFDVVINPRIDIWHRYQTDSGKDGGIVEFSTDSGATWINVVGGCMNSGPINQIEIDSFYTEADSLPGGTASFSGLGILHSSLIFWDCIGVKSTSVPACNFGFSHSFYLRFRFVSDSVADTLSGWKIDSIKIAEQSCLGGFVRTIKPGLVNILPNPARNELKITYTIPITHVTICNLVGTQVYNHDYNDNDIQIDISTLLPGIYLIRINDSEIRRFVKE